MLVLFALAGTAALDQDTMLCEEAIAHLQTCCPGLEAPNVCGVGEGYCSPATNLERSVVACIEDLPCGDPHTEEVCERIEQLSASTDTYFDEDPAPEEVCP